jgi:uncharacterized protein
MARSTLRRPTSVRCSNGRYLESQLMDSLNPENPPPLSVEPVRHRRRLYGFWGTALWGLFGFAAMAVGQIAVVMIFVMIEGAPDGLMEAIKAAATSGLVLSLSVIAGLPATLAALWFAIRWTREPFADYLALRWPSRKDALIGVIGLVVLVTGWELLSHAVGHEGSPDFMMDVVKSASGDSVLWLMIVAFCIAAPVTEEFLARGFLYRGWSETFLKVPGAICLSSLMWSALHVQYDFDWVLFGQVFCLGLWFGYLRYRSNSIWLTTVLHGLNNLGALLESMWLAGH